jgi:hypothetical protein
MGLPRGRSSYLPARWSCHSARQRGWECHLHAHGAVKSGPPCKQTKHNSSFGELSAMHSVAFLSVCGGCTFCGFKAVCSYDGVVNKSYSDFIIIASLPSDPGACNATLGFSKFSNTHAVGTHRSCLVVTRSPRRVLLENLITPDGTQLHRTV